MERFSLSSRKSQWSRSSSTSSTASTWRARAGRRRTCGAGRASTAARSAPTERWVTQRRSSSCQYCPVRISWILDPLAGVSSEQNTALSCVLGVWRWIGCWLLVSGNCYFLGVGFIGIFFQVWWYKNIKYQMLKINFHSAASFQQWLLSTKWEHRPE